ncbi:MAG TPA: hypothetical protein VHU82_00755 [Vicinamibacterales bacterium]|jgi:hypothetical protein|nr:hypothetical protein [Vicinamibacterales bacterium]
MTTPDETPTVEMSLQALSDAVGKAVDDYRAVRTVLDRARADIASRNTAITRGLVVSATKAIDHLRGADQALRTVLKELEERD